MVQGLEVTVQGGRKCPFWDLDLKPHTMCLLSPEMCPSKSLWLHSQDPVCPFKPSTSSFSALYMPFSLLCILFSTNTVPYLTPIARLALYLRFSALYVPFSVPSVPFQPSMCLTQLCMCPFQSVMCLIYVDLQFGPLLFGIKHVRLIWKATRHRQIIRYRPEIQMAPMTLLAEFFVLFVVIITPPPSLPSYRISQCVLSF